MSLRKIARNKNRDDVLKLFEDVAHRVTSPDWQVFALQDQYQNLIEGQGEKCKLITYSLLRPTIFEGFASATIAGACFEDSMLYRLWTTQDCKLKPVHDRLRRELRYDRHLNGDLITILYCTEEEWSKSFRDKMVEVDQTAIKLLDRIIDAVGHALEDEPFLWMGNNDLPNDLFEHKPGAQRLPNSPHGLNEFQSFHNVVVLSALNPPPAHFHFMGDKGINGEEIKTAHYRGAVYQAVMRCSARNPDDPNPKRFVVMDQGTAEWLADLFPGATIAPLDGMGVQVRKGRPGRKRQHVSNAAKASACRAKQKREWLAQLDLINGTSVIAGRYPWFAQEVASRMSEFGCNENTVYRGDIVTPSLTSGTAFASIYDPIPLDHVDYTDDESFIAGLRDLHGRVVATKEDAGLIASAHFDRDLSADTSRGLDNVRHIRGIWLDNDGGDLSHAEFVRLFPFLRVVVWNTYSHTLEKPRWRAFIPTTYAMSKDVHQIIMAQIERVLNRKGYWSKKQLEKTPRIKTRLIHGFDQSKFNAASLFYLPCQAQSPKDSFFIDHNEEQRGPLDLHRWIEHCILDLRPEVEPEPVNPSGSSVPAALTPDQVSANLQAVRDKLLVDRTVSAAGRQETIMAKAIENWRSASRGDGHAAFFRLGAALQRAGLDEGDIRRTLHAEAAHAYSPKERRGEIKGIIRSLRKRGTL